MGVWLCVGVRMMGRGVDEECSHCMGLDQQFGWELGSGSVCVCGDITTQQQTLLLWQHTHECSHVNKEVRGHGNPIGFSRTEERG